ncbi:hypothetical protein VXN63_02280 [Marinilactibacillus sp. XAAS-LB27]|uniref:hypothetical protein n=1 Tax=Marinilactibacillus sp. XAAS-LB27 TaxID=3114538 RepID=UPI002E17029B|nr:hypothetical protein [Marinilactibacillus sp. XAAS-LB27]
MNAQEAINEMSNELHKVKETQKVLQEQEKRLIDLGLYSEVGLKFQMESLATKHESLSIVLESARFLHEKLLSNQKHDNRGSITNLYLNTSIEEVVSVETKYLNKIGIEVDIDGK